MDGDNREELKNDPVMEPSDFESITMGTLSASRRTFLC